MINTQTIANTILYLAFKEDYPITHMKLQKMIYIVYKSYLKETNQKLFTEAFGVWKYGPVLPSVYYEFHVFGQRNITRFAKNANGGVEIIDLDKDTAIAKSIKYVWRKYRDFSAWELSDFTHCKDGAWDKANMENRNTLIDEDIKNEPNFK